MNEHLTVRTSTIREWFTIACLLTYSGAFLPLFRQSSGNVYDAAAGDSTAQAIFLVIYLISTIFVIRRWDDAALFINKNRWLFLLLFLAVASALWSSNPQVTLRSSIALIGTTIFGLYLVCYYDLSQQIRLILWTLGIAIGFSIFFALLLPQLGKDAAFGGAWRGIFVHKNVLGRVLVLAAILNLTLIWQRGKHMFLYWTFFAIAFAIILFSQSVTSLFAVCVIIALYPLFNLLHRGVPSQLIIYFMFISTLIAILLIGWYMDEIELFLGIFGKTSTLTGRTRLWQILIPIIERQPWLGYGYNGFWFGNSGESYAVWSNLSWHPNHAHNGLIDLILELGFVGATIFFVTFIMAFVRAIRVISSTDYIGSLWPFVFLIYFMIANSTQSVILQTNNLFWILYVSLMLITSFAPEPENEWRYIEPLELESELALGMAGD